MDAMRTIIAGTLSLLLFATSMAHAADTGAIPGNAGIDGKNDCPAGTTGDPTGSQSFPASGDSSLKVRRYLTTIEKCASACYDIRIDVSVTDTLKAAFGGTATFVISANAQNKCTKDPSGKDPSKDNRGCATGQIQPQEWVSTPGISVAGFPAQTKGPLSRCFGAGATTFNNLFNAKYGGKDAGIGALKGAFDDLGTYKPIAPADTSALTTPGPTQEPSASTAGTDALSNALQTSGLSADEAKQITSQADVATKQDLIAAYATGDRDKISDAVQDAADKTGVALNDNVYDKIASLTPAQTSALAAGTAGMSMQSDQNAPKNDSTFAGTGSGATTAPIQPSLAETLAPLCNQSAMKGCGNACTIDPSKLTCRTNNPGALTWSPWQAQYGGTPCGTANNTTCFPTVEQGIAAQANLLTTSSRYFGNGNNTIIGAFCNGYSTANCAPYANFISAQTGIPLNQTIDPQNPQQIGAILMASSRYENGNGVIYTPNQLQAGLQAVYSGGVLPNGTPGYTSSTVYGTGGGQNFGSAFNFNPYSAAPASMAGIGSPFSNVTPIPTAYLSNIASPFFGNTQGSGYRPNSYPTGKPLPGPIGYSTAAPQPVASIIAAPSIVTRGQNIIISWSTANMRTDTPCVILSNATLIASGNGGAKVLHTSSSTPTGITNFLLQCAAQANGQTITRGASITVQ